MQTAKELDLESAESGIGEADLLEGLKQGSLPAFERLYQAHGERMKSIALNLLGNVADAEDAVQDAFLKVHRGAARFRGGSSLATWLYRILVNTCYDRLRRNRRRPEAPLPARLATTPAMASDPPLRLSIEMALRRLPERERAAFLLCEIEGFSHRDAGEVLHVNEAASRALLFRAKRELQRALRAGGTFRPAEGS